MDQALDLVVIGAQKSGSTHLARCLGEHPDLYMVAHEVPYFQDPYYANSSPSSLTMALGSSGSRLAIKRPDYLTAAEVPDRLASHSPHTRVVAVLRDPVRRLVSAVYWYMQFGDLPLLDLNRTLRMLLDQEVILGFPRSGELLPGSDYGTALRQWQKSFPLDQIDVYSTPDLAQQRTYDHLFEELGIEPFSPPSLTSKTNEGIYDRRRLALLRQRRAFLFDWPDSGVYVSRSPRRQAGWRYPIAGVLKAFDQVFLAPFFRRCQEELQPEVRARLVERYRPQVQMVHEDFGVSLHVDRTGATTHE